MGQELRDETGKLVGVFYSAEEHRKLETERALLESFRQEVQDRGNGVTRVYDGTNGMTTAEAIAYIERLGREAHEGK